MYEGDPVYAPVAAFVDELFRAGVEHICVCPGARSTALALAVANHPRLRAWSHIDERSAAFFTLGIAKTTRRPAAVVCTSGTAAANFLPAVIEASYSHLPLLALTADRPPELRDCGAPQTIDQIKLYGSNVRWFADAGTPDVGERYFRSLARRAVAAASATPPGPVHINFPFREPLMPSVDAGKPGGDPVHDAAGPRAVVHEPDRAAAAATLGFLEGLVVDARRGLLVCGPYDGNERFAQAVSRFAARAGYPILADPLSQLRTGSHDTDLVLNRYDALLRDQAFASRAAPELVLRCGAIPTSKALLQYLERHSPCRQVLLDPLGFWRDPTLMATEVLRADPTLLLQALTDRLCSVEPDGTWCQAWLEADRHASATIAARLEAMTELFEGKVFAELAELVPAGTTLYVCNSMPVRDLDGFWPLGSRRVRFLCNRGANGIDGFVSSGLGAAAVSDGPVVMVTGDLGFYHDLNGLLAVRRHDLRATIIVLNNNGGGIFGFLPQAECGRPFEEFFVTPHGLDFRAAAEMYGVHFCRVVGWGEFREAVGAALIAERATVIEVPVDGARNVALHREIWAEVGAALRGDSTVQGREIPSGERKSSEGGRR